VKKLNTKKYQSSANYTHYIKLSMSKYAILPNVLLCKYMYNTDMNMMGKHSYLVNKQYLETQKSIIVKAILVIINMYRV